MKRLCVFLGSSIGVDPLYAEAAGAFGTLLARRGIGLVYGGGSVGLMGVLASAAVAAGGEVIGVIPRALDRLEGGQRGLTRLHIVETMHERKALMAELSDGFVALPGGIGTMEELFEVWTWAQLGYHAKPVGLLQVRGFWQPFLDYIGHLVAEGFIAPATRGLLLSADSGEALLDALDAYVRPDAPTWLPKTVL